MPEPEPRVDRDASEAIKRIETQMRMEGKLENADVAEGAAILFLPLVLGVVGLVAWVLQSAGLEGVGMVFVGVPILIGLGLLGCYLASRK